MHVPSRHTRKQHVPVNIHTTCTYKAHVRNNSSSPNNSSATSRVPSVGSNSFTPNQITPLQQVNQLTESNTTGADLIDFNSPSLTNLQSVFVESDSISTRQLVGSIKDIYQRTVQDIQATYLYCAHILMGLGACTGASVHVYSCAYNQQAYSKQANKKASSCGAQTEEASKTKIYWASIYNQPTARVQVPTPTDSAHNQTRTCQQQTANQFPNRGQISPYAVATHDLLAASRQLIPLPFQVQPGHKDRCTCEEDSYKINCHNDYDNSSATPPRSSINYFQLLGCGDPQHGHEPS